VCGLPQGESQDCRPPGLRTLRAATSHDNAASQKVLAKAGFVPVGPAIPADLGGKSGTWYQRDLQP
jgi:ribosomal-protein-alanine N-acetyltransferase